MNYKIKEIYNIYNKGYLASQEERYELSKLLDEVNYNFNHFKYFEESKFFLVEKKFKPYFSTSNDMTYIQFHVYKNSNNIYAFGLSKVNEPPICPLIVSEHKWGVGFKSNGAVDCWSKSCKTCGMHGSLHRNGKYITPKFLMTCDDFLVKSIIT